MSAVWRWKEFRRRAAGVIVAVAASSAWGFEPFVVRDIRVEGIQRVEPGTVFAYLPVRIGEQVTRELANEAIQRLFETGFFSNVTIDREGEVLVVRVEERPAIGEIVFVGMKEFEPEQVRKALRELGVAEARIFDRSLLRQAEQELKRQYLAKGKYGAEVTTTVTPLPRNRVAITFQVQEGETAKIREIRIVGAQAFPEKELLERFQLTTPGWFTWYTRSDQYSREKLSQDLEGLKSFYLNRGFLDFRVDSASVAISPDKRDIFITIAITEGKPYRVSGVKVVGDFPLAAAELAKAVVLSPGDLFSREKLDKSVQGIIDRLGEEGFAFANVQAVPTIDRERQEVAVTLLVDAGRRMYVRRIEIGGNSRTRDEVIRRELRQLEGEWYDVAKLQKSKQRLERLGYFEEVRVETEPVPETTDQLDVRVTVKERPTGSLMVGAGFSSDEKLVLMGSIAQENFLGTGKSLAAAVDTSRSRRSASLSFTDPYYTVEGVSVGYDLYRRVYDPRNAASIYISNYKTKSLGGGIRVGWPIGEDDRVHFGLSADHTAIETFADSPKRYRDFCAASVYDCDGISTLALTAGWSRDTRDSRLIPRQGVWQRLSGEVDLPPGDVRLVRLVAQHQHWFPFFERSALMLNAEVGVQKAYGEREVPFYRNFYAGGVTSVRGFRAGSLGLKDENGDAYGGTRRLLLSAEYFLPMPATGQDRSLRWSLFVDSGYVWDAAQRARLSDLRVSTGVGLSWISPIGPLRFALAFPVRKDLDEGPGQRDRTERFQFQLGAVF
ncbi:MAG: outer membrane protein assembly factor BamA [Hydrogenophilus sp.]|nr:outer membrane protein assembly factor BamA [Hydrogenophilus sp.]